MRVLCGDVRAILPTLADNSIQMCLSSPPYWNLRNYGTGQWVGGEANCLHQGGRRDYTGRTAGAMSHAFSARSQ